MQLGDASRVAPVDKLGVVFVAVIAAVFLGWTGIGLITCGAIIPAIAP